MTHMKRTFNGMPAALFLGGAILLGSCDSSDKTTGERIDNMENRLDEKADAARDWLEFRKEAKADIAENRTKIAELRSKQSGDGVDDKIRQERIDMLQKKNDKLEQDITTYESSADHKDNARWNEFKREFRHDMDEFGAAFEDIGKNNKD